MDHYGAQGHLRRVNGNGTIDAVAEAILEATAPEDVGGKGA